jgi:hypothetical protein
MSKYNPHLIKPSITNDTSTILNDTTTIIKTDETIIQPKISDSKCPYKDKLPNNLSKYIMAKKSLLKETLVAKSIDIILENVQHIPIIEKYKFSYEFIKFIGCLIENIVDKKTTKDEKSQLLFEVQTKIFGELTDDDIIRIQDAYDFLIENKKIKKITLSKKILYEAYYLIVGLFSTSLKK